MKYQAGCTEPSCPLSAAPAHYDDFDLAVWFKNAHHGTTGHVAKLFYTETGADVDLTAFKADATGASEGRLS